MRIPKYDSSTTAPRTLPAYQNLYSRFCVVHGVRMSPNFHGMDSSSGIDDNRLWIDLYVVRLCNTRATGHQSS
jgi:hypothetical protein